jgi:hypothetical protein
LAEGTPSSAPRWTRHFVHRSPHLRTTWRFRLGLAALLLGIAALTSGCWTVALARSLVCSSDTAPSDAILIENFDPEYLLFERAARLYRAGLAPRVLVPVPADAGTIEPNAVLSAIAETMARIGRLPAIDIVPVREVEPISLHAAVDIRDFLKREGIRSVIVVSPLFRSRRSDLVYRATLGPAGVTVRCDAVEGTRQVTTWFKTGHGIQDVTEQWLKLQYYRLYVLPFRAASDS